MVILKNNTQSFDHNSLELYLKSKETDCFLYSREGVKFKIHKEILYYTKLMRNILHSTKNYCCKEIEIFCPCSKDELESMVNFLYTGTFSSDKQISVTELNSNLTKILGFPKNVFCVQDQTEIVDDTNTVFIPLNPEEDNSDNDPLTSLDTKNCSFSAENSTFGTENSTFSTENSTFSDQSSKMLKSKGYGAILDNGKKQMHSSFKKTVEKPFEKNENRNTFACSICNKKLKSEGHHRRHLNSCHQFEKPFECPMCNNNFEFENALTKHIISFHKGVTPFQCNICDRKFNQKGNWKTHYSLNHSVQCNVCDKKFARETHLNEHHSIIHGSEKFKCSLCKIGFTSRENRNSHIESIHEFGNPRKCKFCQKVYRTRGELRTHILIVHVGKRPFQCNICGKTCKRRTHLKTHLLLDHVYPCNSCDKKFVLKTHLKMHNASIH